MTRRLLDHRVLLLATAIAMAGARLAHASRPSALLAPAVHTVALSGASRMCVRGNACVHRRRAEPVPASTAPRSALSLGASHRGAVVVARAADGSRRLPAPIALSRDAARGAAHSPCERVAGLLGDAVIRPGFFYEAHAPPPAQPTRRRSSRSARV